jgi:hypothetical protein
MDRVKQFRNSAVPDKKKRVGQWDMGQHVTASFRNIRVSENCSLGN